jgi:hypothetical protein
MLLDSFGRRSAFALGASLGVAGGLMLAWGLAEGRFFALVLGAFWLGVANGFSLFFRHAAAGLGGSGQAVAVVFGAGAAAGLIAPSLAGWAEGLGGGATFVGTALAAALAHVASLAATLTLPPIRPQPSPAPLQPRAWLQALPAATAVAAVAWFAMTALMGATPLAMAGCGLSGSLVTQAVAWHVVAMYGPALIVPRGLRLSPGVLVGAGASCLTVAAVLFWLANGAFAFAASAALVGVGWCLVSIGTTLWLHRAGPPPRWGLAAHDAVLLTSALLGALAAAPAGL